ncbi:hypothetical protein HO133_001631 [Letharia lupina]|uniref:Uncharacterized protein n=1 Tax=Letharia lupina TaxID=560253 RepID=A0A8H6CE09_9LECA|nr:uncharacterized protein HO133_001631 [Letharia lupina]KAF6221663.1 hypothetical protein HO133_001631 [Letharia lupina]
MLNLSLHGPVSLPLQVGPSPVIPTAPDYGICDRRYGDHLTPLLCGWAAETLIKGDSLVPYTVRGGVPGPQTLPYTAIFGNCKIWIEIAGPATPQIYEAVPNEIREMAGWVIEQCVGGNGRGHGGFATKDISELTAYVTEPDANIGGMYPISSAFLTVTVTGAWDQSIMPPSPGNYDPSIAQHLADVEIDAWHKAAPGSPLRQDFASRQQFFTRQSMRMQTGGSSITWWDSNPRIATSEK